MIKRTGVQLLLMLLLSLLAVPAFAQTTTAALGGRITSTGGEPVVGADVVVVHTPSGTTSRATTGPDGRFISRGLRVGGPYSVSITADGYRGSRQDDVYLLLGETGNVSLAMSPDATDLETIEVVASAGSDIFNPNRTGAGTSISRDDLDSFASIQRNLQDYARLDPRISQTDKDRGEITVAGQNNRFNTITIDGVNTSDTFGLEANNLPTQKQPISIDAIDQVQINISNVDVSQRGYTGANINAVTKSGTNDFRGSVYYVWRDDSLSGDRFAGDDEYVDPPESEDETYGITFGGPLIKDRLFFFLSYEDYTSTRVGNQFVPLGGVGTEVLIDPADIAATRNFAQSLYGIDIGTVDAPTTAALTVEDILVKVDWAISDNHRASLRYNKTEESNPIFPGNFGNALSLSSHWYNQDKTIEALVGQWYADWTDTFSTEFRASRREYYSQPINASNLPQVGVRQTLPGVGGFRTLTFGTERSRHFNELGTDTDDLFFAGNLYLGDHEVKIGADYQTNQVFNAFLQDTRGNYTFGCLYDSQCLNSFEAGRPLSYSVQVPRAGQTLLDGVATWDLNNTGFFIQDTWAVNYNLTVVMGLRYDRTGMPDSPLFNAAASAAQGPIVNGRRTGGFGYDNSQTLDGKTLLQPRFGFNYTFDWSRPTQLRGGLGLFEGSAANVWLSNPYSNTGIATQVVGCGITGFAPCPTEGPGIFNGNPANQPTDFAGAIPASNVDFLSSDLRQPAVWKANLAFEHELPWWGAVFGAELLFTQVKHGVFYQHLNLGDATRLGADGREMFWSPGGYNGACFNANGSINTSACSGAGAVRTRFQNNASFNNVLLAQRTNKGSGENLTLSLVRPRGDDGWNWSVAYNFSNATEVSPLTSSVANSSFNSRAIFNPNEEFEARSPYVVRDRFVATLGWSHDFFGDNTTNFGLVYEGRTGRPYSWTFGNDMNGDGVAGNDLLFIPSGPGSDQVTFQGGADEEAHFWNEVNRLGLAQYAGGVVDRYSHSSPWTNNFDFRISQELPGFWAHHKTELVFDLLNVGNLLNKRWGRINEVGFQGGGGQARSFVDYVGMDDQGRYIYSLDDGLEDTVTRQNRGESQWAAQITLRYRF